MNRAKSTLRKTKLCDALMQTLNPRLTSPGLKRTAREDRGTSSGQEPGSPIQFKFGGPIAARPKANSEGALRLAGGKWKALWRFDLNKKIAASLPAPK